MNAIRHARSDGFSLPEVSMSLAIVAALVLPVVGILMGAGSTQREARDRADASRIVRDLAGSLGLSRDGAFELRIREAGDPGDGPLGESLWRIVRGDSSTPLVLALDEFGRLVAELSEGDYRSGVSADRRAAHLVRVRLAQATPGDASLFEVEVSVEHPAAAAEPHRRKEPFPTRLLAR